MRITVPLQIQREQILLGADQADFTALETLYTDAEPYENLWTIALQASEDSSEHFLGKFPSPQLFSFDTFLPFRL